MTCRTGITDELDSDFLKEISSEGDDIELQLILQTSRRLLEAGAKTSFTLHCWRTFVVLYSSCISQLLRNIDWKGLYFSFLFSSLN